MGGTVYGDFTVEEDGDSPVYTNLNAFLPGIGRVDPHGTPSAVEYYHSNQIGTTRAMTDDGGDDEQDVVYTAFGERIDGTNHRYGYAGAWGYRWHDDFSCDAQSPEYQFPYLHVGWRYYDPANGRFLQRDPIGIWGGINVYAYVMNQPTILVDPMGLDWRDSMFDWVARNFWMRFWSRKRLAQMGDAEAYAWAIGCSVVGGVGIYYFVVTPFVGPSPPPPPGSRLPLGFLRGWPSGDIYPIPLGLY